MKIKLLIVLLCLLLHPILAEEDCRIGKIDLCFAVSLHPRMALFDFERLGFYKMDFGLSQQEFEAEKNRLRDNPVSDELSKKSEDYRLKLERIGRDGAAIMDLIYSANQAEGEKLSKKLDSLDSEGEKLRVGMEDISYRIENPDLTPMGETRKILNEIESELIAAIKQVSEKEKLDIVLNSSTPYTTGYPTRYRIGVNYGNGAPGIDTYFFYSFLGLPAAPNNPDLSPSSWNVTSWLELTHYPEAMKVLPVQPWPLVLKGGRNILPEVLNIVYNEYEIDSDVIDVVCSLASEADNRFLKAR